MNIYGSTFKTCKSRVAVGTVTRTTGYEIPTGTGTSTPSNECKSARFELPRRVNWFSGSPPKHDKSVPRGVMSKQSERECFTQLCDVCTRDNCEQGLSRHIERTPSARLVKQHFHSTVRASLALVISVPRQAVGLVLFLP